MRAVRETHVQIAQGIFDRNLAWNAGSGGGRVVDPGARPDGSASGRTHGVWRWRASGAGGFGHNFRGSGKAGSVSSDGVGTGDGGGELAKNLGRRLRTPHGTAEAGA